MKTWQKLALALIVPGGILVLGLYELGKYAHKELNEDKDQDIEAMIFLCVDCPQCQVALKRGAGAYLQHHLVDFHDCKPSFADAVLREMFKRYYDIRSRKE